MKTKPLEVGDMVVIEAEVRGLYWSVETHHGRLAQVVVTSAMPGSCPVQFMVPEAALTRRRRQ